MSTGAIFGCVCKDGKIRVMGTTHDGYPSAVVPKLYKVDKERLFVGIWKSMIDCEYDDYEFPFEYVMREQFIGGQGKPVECDTIKDFICTTPFAFEYYLLKDGEWYLGEGWKYNDNYLYNPATGFRSREINGKEFYKEGIWIPLKEFMVSRTVIEHGFNEKAYLKMLYEKYPERFNEEYSSSTLDEVLEDASEF